MQKDEYSSCSEFLNVMVSSVSSVKWWCWDRDGDGPGTWGVI